MTTPSKGEAEQKLQELLLKGLDAIRPRWLFKAGHQVICMCAMDIDNDGDIEIIFGAADGRLYVVSREGELQWARIVGDKSPITAVAIFPRLEGTRKTFYIVAGTKSGYLYVFNKRGQTVNKDKEKTTNPFSPNSEEDIRAFWFNCDRSINQISITPDEAAHIIFTSEDRHVYALNWVEEENPPPPFLTNGWARCIFACDLNNDGHAEILVSTANRSLYLLDHHGQQIREKLMEYPIRALHAEDINDDGEIEILVATDKHDLIAYTAEFEELWNTSEFINRLRAVAILNIDRDNARVIVAGGDDKHLYVLDSDGKLLWRHYLDARIVSMCTADIDGDGAQKVILGADDERVHVLSVNLFWAKANLYGDIRATYRSITESSPDLPPQLSASERGLLRDISDNGREKLITQGEAQNLLRQSHFEQALAAFLQLKQQRVQVLWHKETGHEVKILGFGSILGDIIVGTTEGMLRAYEDTGKESWTYQLSPDQILSGQIGRIQGPRHEDILVCSTGCHIYVIGYPSRRTKSKRPQVLKDYPAIDPLISSVALMKPGYSTEIVFGSENQKIYVYQNGLEGSYTSITTPQGIRLVQPYISRQKSPDIPDIIAASLDNRVTAYKCADGRELWKFQAYHRIRALTVKDIDGDEYDEIIIGSEDRNIHVVDYKGRLKWRYYLPYSVLATHVADINRDGQLEVLAGCADGYLYVFNKTGDLLWKYQADERITAIASREGEDSVEVALGTESRVELLHVLDQNHLHAEIDHCWKGLKKRYNEAQVVKGLLTNAQEPAVRAFALQKAPALLTNPDELWTICSEAAKDSSVEVRKGLVIVLMCCYAQNPDQANRLLEKLSLDREREVRLTLIEHIASLMNYDWEMGFEYLTRFADHSDRFVRRAVMRQLYCLIDERREHYWVSIFHLLLKGICDKTVWVCQEAARSLAHYLDNHHWDLLQDLHRFIVKDVALHILLHIAHHATVPDVSETLDALVQMLQDDLNIENATDRLQLTVQALQRIKNSHFGEDTLLLFKEHYELFNLRSLQEIAQYQCRLRAHQPEPSNQHFPVARRVFEAIHNLARILKIYLQRQNVNDKISSLQEACRAIDRLHNFMDREYQTKVQGEPLTKLPDHKFFELLFKRWREMAQAQLNELLGKPEIKTELLTRQLYFERRISLLLKLQNIGRSPAYSVHVELLHSDDFTRITPLAAQTEILFWHDFLRAEFTIEFSTFKENVDLDFEITYDDGENEFRKFMFKEHLLLSPMEAADYEFVPNPYSTGTPTSDKSMFFGREQDIELLKRELTMNTAQRIVVLHGLRRSGKTSLLRYLVKNELLENCIPIYIDMQNIIHGITTNRLFFKIAYNIHREVTRKTSCKLVLPTQTSFRDDPTFTFDRFLDDVESLLQGQRVVLLIDEFEILQEQADQGLLSPTLFRYLRSLMQDRNMNFLLAGTHQLEQLTHDYWSVFYSFALPHRLSKITSEGAESLITVPVGQQLKYDPFAVEKIRDLAGDQPFLLNSLCRILVDHCNDLRKAYVTLHDVNALLPHAVLTNSIQFNGLWQQISPEEQFTLVAIAQAGSERPLSPLEIEDIYRAERIPYEQRQLHDTLGSLAQQDLLECIYEEEERENRRYRIAIGLLVLWLNQEQSFSRLKQQRKALANGSKQA